MTPTELVLRRSLPVFINSFNQLHYLRELLANLSNHGFSNLWILDNQSTYPKLLEFYKTLNDVRPGNPQVLYYPENFGPRHFHLTSLYTSVWPYPHFYTDPDILLPAIDEAFAGTLLALSNRFQVAKVGSALTLPDPEKLRDFFASGPETGTSPVSVLDWEKQFWKNELDDGIYGTSIDTTFHLFNPAFFVPENFLHGIRVARPGFQAKHRPWFNDDLPPADEYEFYRESRKGFGNWI